MLIAEFSIPLLLSENWTTSRYCQGGGGNIMDHIMLIIPIQSHNMWTSGTKSQHLVKCIFSDIFSKAKETTSRLDKWKYLHQLLRFQKYHLPRPVRSGTLNSSSSEFCHLCVLHVLTSSKWVLRSEVILLGLVPTGLRKYIITLHYYACKRKLGEGKWPPSKNLPHPLSCWCQFYPHQDDIIRGILYLQYSVGGISIVPLWFKAKRPCYISRYLEIIMPK